MENFLIFTKKSFTLVTFLIGILIVIVSLIDIITYQGFVQKHFPIDTTIIFWLFVFANYIIVPINKPSDYWWNSKYYGFLQKQSKSFPYILGFYLILQAFENLNYPNFIYSKLHIYLISFLPLLRMQFFLLVLPYLGSFQKRYIRVISKDLKLREIFVTIWFPALVWICILVIK